jgi:hypothetical protein
MEAAIVIGFAIALIILFCDLVELGKVIYDTWRSARTQHHPVWLAHA